MLDLPIHPYLTHPLTGCPLQAIGRRRDGAPIWPVLGGAEGDGDGSGASGEGEGDNGGEGKPGGEPGAGEQGSGDQLGEGGKKALAAERTARAEAEKAAKALQVELDALKEKSLSAEEKALADARREGEKAATERANDRIVRAEVKRLAADKLADPTDALTGLDLSKFAVDDGGDVDEAAITAAIDELLVRKPHYAKPNGEQNNTGKGKVPAGPADQGQRPPGAKRAGSLEEAVGNVYAAR